MRLVVRGRNWVITIDTTEMKISGMCSVTLYGKISLQKRTLTDHTQGVWIHLVGIPEYLQRRQLLLLPVCFPTHQVSSSTLSPFWEGVYYRRKEFAPPNSFLFIVDHFSEGRQDKFVRGASLESISVHTFEQNIWASPWENVSLRHITLLSPCNVEPHIPHNI